MLTGDKKNRQAYMELLGLSMSLMGLRHEFCFILRVDDIDFSKEFLNKATAYARKMIMELGMSDANMESLIHEWRGILQKNRLRSISLCQLRFLQNELWVTAREEA